MSLIEPTEPTGEVNQCEIEKHKEEIKRQCSERDKCEKK